MGGDRGLWLIGQGWRCWRAPGSQHQVLGGGRGPAVGLVVVGREFVLVVVGRLVVAVVVLVVFRIVGLAAGLGSEDPGLRLVVGQRLAGGLPPRRRPRGARLVQSGRGARARRHGPVSCQ